MVQSNDPIPVGFKHYFGAAPEGAEQAFLALGAAHELTNELAVRLLEECGGIPGLEPSKFVSALHYSNFIIPRNDGVWAFSSEYRSWLAQRLLDTDNEALMIKAHRLLQEIGEAWQEPDKTMPSYLDTIAGRAYHTSFLDPELGPFGGATFGVLPVMLIYR